MTWIFLHGLGQAPSAWQPVLRRLEPELTVHCPSLAELAAGDPRYPALLSALETALDSIPGPLHLCGLSLGGVLAMDYALRHPKRVASLVLCGTPLTHAPEPVAAAGFPVPSDAGTGLCRQRLQPGCHASAGWLHGRAGPPSPASGAGLSGAGALRQQGPCQPQGRPGTGRTAAPGPAALGLPEPDMKPTWIRRK